MGTLRTHTGRFAALLILMFPASALFPASAMAQLINGGQPNPDVISIGETKSYTFMANANADLKFRIGQTNTTAFRPRLTVFDPNGVPVPPSSCGSTGVADFSFTASSTGTYTIEVSNCGGSVAVGSYNLYFVGVPGANEGGTLTNGGQPHSGAIDFGDLDSYTFPASAGEGVQLRIGKTSGSVAFRPRYIVYGPNGTIEETTCSTGNIGASVFSAPSAGTYTVVVLDCFSTGNQTGTYDLYFTRAPGANELGSLNDGLVRNEQIDIGDLDSYSFSANAGDSIQATAQVDGAINRSPRFTIYDPTGALEFTTPDTACSSGIADHSFTAVAAGTYTLIVYDCAANADEAWPYTLVLTGATGPPVPSVPALPLVGLVGLASMLVGIGVHHLRFSVTGSTLVC